jgi:hypothetical protein
MTYTYQWQRCDTSGGACAPITGATAPSYLLASTDVGRTMRVSITASNSAGSATASSAATAVVTAVSATASPWWTSSFESPEVLPAVYPNTGGTPWNSLLLSPVSGHGAIVPDPTNSANNVFQSRTGPGGTSYADWSILIQTYARTHGWNGSEVWVKQRVYFPLDFKPCGWSSGNGYNCMYNGFLEFHNNMDYKTLCPDEIPEIAITILDADPNGSWGAPQPRFRVHLLGGTETNSTSCRPNDRWFDGPQLQRGHWYTFLQHVKFSPDAGGLYELWIDGQQVVDAPGPTLFRRPDGTVDQTYFQAGYYRHLEDWEASVYYDDFKEGPTLDSVQ